ncbi:hypothetical protein CHF27_011075 [Romboutsia maritimum]|uniref:dUTPase n=1 Tax=Romboutsia maritimum TaxID=2020948 RepID=A0A371IQU2_9FIRM|nr:dUTP diphosphatase [Romboutsia maritimum]RDY22855.1 hypothetical protein CHF27_011075 [Romboutsia maritimum]
MIIDFTDIQSRQVEFIQYLKERPKVIDKKESCKFTDEEVWGLKSELAEVENEMKCHKYWDLSEIDDNKVLEEMSDVLSHLCNIANESNIKLILDIELKQTNELMKQFTSLDKQINDLIGYKKQYAELKIKRITLDYMILLYSLGFTLEELRQAYLNKMESNYSRFS